MTLTDIGLLVVGMLAAFCAVLALWGWLMARQLREDDPPEVPTQLRLQEREAQHTAAVRHSLMEPGDQTMIGYRWPDGKVRREPPPGRDGRRQREEWIDDL